MAELQSRLGAVPMAETAAPRNLGDGGTDLLRAASGVLDQVSGMGRISAERAAKQAQLNTDGSIAQAGVIVEGFKRREPLREAIAAGHLTEAQAKNFGVDEANSLSALNQASAQGMGHSVRNALERSVRYQFAAMNNPGAAKELAAAYGIGKTGVEQDTLDSLERVEREQLEADADSIRKLAADEGYSDFLDKSNEEVLEMWVDSPAAQRNRRISQNQRIALDQTADIGARAPAASKAISLSYSNVGRSLDRIQSQYAATRGTLNAGTDGTSLSLAEELSLAGEGLISEMKRTYPDFPKLTEAYANGVRTSITQRLSSKKQGIELGNAEYSAQVLRPMELELKHLSLENAVLDQSNNQTRALENRVELSSRIFRSEQDMVELKDKINSNPSTFSPMLQEFVNGDGFDKRQALYSAAGVESNLMLNELLNPGQVSATKAVEQAVVNLSILANTGIGGDQASFKKAISDLDLYYRSNQGVSPTKNAKLSATLLKLADDPAFVTQVQKSPAVRKLLEPYAEGIKAEVIQSFQGTMNQAAKDSVMRTGAARDTILPWSRLAEAVVLDSGATNKMGVPQLKLMDGFAEQLTTQGDKVRYATHLEKYNTGLRMTQNPKQHALLKSLSGSSSLAESLKWVIGTSDGITLETLDPARVPAPALSDGITKQDVIDSLVGTQ